MAVRTAPEHSYINPPEKINCILNLGLNAVGCVRTAIHSSLGFEKQLSNCSGVDDVRNLLKRNPTVHTNLLKQPCSNIPSLIKFIFNRLLHKGKTFVVCDAILDEKVDFFFFFF